MYVQLQLVCEWGCKRTEFVEGAVIKSAPTKGKFYQGLKPTTAQQKHPREFIFIWVVKAPFAQIFIVSKSLNNTSFKFISRLIATRVVPLMGTSTRVYHSNSEGATSLKQGSSGYQPQQQKDISHDTDHQGCIPVQDPWDQLQQRMKN